MAFYLSQSLLFLGEMLGSLLMSLPELTLCFAFEFVERVLTLIPSIDVLNTLIISSTHLANNSSSQSQAGSKAREFIRTHVLYNRYDRVYGTDSCNSCRGNTCAQPFSVRFCPPKVSCTKKKLSPFEQLLEEGKVIFAELARALPPSVDDVSRSAILAITLADFIDFIIFATVEPTHVCLFLRCSVL